MTPFEVAERYIQLRRKFKTDTWIETITHMNDLVVSPFISVFLMLTGRASLIFVLTTILEMYKLFKEYYEYSVLRYKVQWMYIMTMGYGGPQITTNDSEYLPYVFADKMVRLGLHHQVPAEHHPPLRHMGYSQPTHENHSR